MRKKTGQTREKNRKNEKKKIRKKRVNYVQKQEKTGQMREKTEKKNRSKIVEKAEKNGSKNILPGIKEYHSVGSSLTAIR